MSESSPLYLRSVGKTSFLFFFLILNPHTTGYGKEEDVLDLSDRVRRLEVYPSADSQNQGIYNTYNIASCHNLPYFTKMSNIGPSRAFCFSKILEKNQ